MCVCVCVCVCFCTHIYLDNIYIYIYIFSNHADSTDFSDSLCPSLSLSPSLFSSVPITHPSWQVCQTTSSVRKELM